MKWVSLFLRLVVGSLFVLSGWLKLTGPVEEFRAAISQYQFIQEPLITWVAHILPWIELIFGVFLILGYMSRVSSLILAILLSSFIFLLTRSLLLKIDVLECGCFGSKFVLKPEQAIWVDSVLFSAALFLGLKGNFSNFSLDAYLTRKSK